MVVVYVLGSSCGDISVAEPGYSTSLIYAGLSETAPAKRKFRIAQERPLWFLSLIIH